MLLNVITIPYNLTLLLPSANYYRSVNIIKKLSLNVTIPITTSCKLNRQILF